MQILEAIILGTLEGATEFLPVSSTGHLILASTLLQIPHSSFLTSFLIAIQLGAICAVVVTFWRSFLDLETLKRLFVAFLPTAIIGFTVYPFVKGYLLGNEFIVVSALFIGGVIMIIFELCFAKRIREAYEQENVITYPQAIAVGFFQSLAIVPGVSRSAATVVGGLLIGMSRVSIVRFSFLLAVPTMGAATTLDIIKSYHTFSASGVHLILIGGITAFLVALVAIRFFLAYVSRHTFIPFGIYRIILATAFFFIVLR